MSKKQSKQYDRPLPINIINLPVVTHNPISWIWCLGSYLKQWYQLKQTAVDIQYCDGLFKVSGSHYMNEVWNSGFIGKGILSRSEPTWLQRTRRRLGLDPLFDERGRLQLTNEETVQIRREERKKFKLKREELEAQENHFKTTGDMTSLRKVTKLKSILIEENRQRQRKPLRELVMENYPVTGDKTEQARATSNLFIDERHIKDLEYLQLMPVEALFLSFCFGFEVNDFNLFELFQLCMSHSLEVDNSFILSYIVYHHYKSHGWCVKSGTKFGSDFLLYRRGPPFQHAEFAVLIQPNNKPSNSPLNEWIDISAISRVVGGVNKTLLLSYVTQPTRDAFQQALDLFAESPTPRSLRNLLELYHIDEFIYRRWLPSRNRA
ncbi:BA75_02030T0 [Komagataella pastoris]|uniref:tRNA-splicing endonuclease subunit Sen2 n=1 Tax=Komagataella pastoris TaxID=4922 RepID=A0A1B2JC85_PICPA|nr:BA75_02030T0 [Komagataella pastoris]